MGVKEKWAKKKKKKKKKKKAADGETLMGKEGAMLTVGMGSRGRNRFGSCHHLVSTPAVDGAANIDRKRW